MTNPFDQLAEQADLDIGREVFRADAVRKREEMDAVISRMARPGRHRKAFQFAGEAYVITEDRSSILRTIKGSTLASRAIPRRANHGLLCGVIEPVANFLKYYRQGPEAERDRPASVPEWLTRMIVDTYGGGLPPLGGVADFPVLTDDDRLLHGKLGYDPETRLYIDCQPVDWELAKFDNAKEALDFLVDDWLGEFHFRSREDAIRAIAIPLTLLMRKTKIHGGSPIPFVTAPSENTGKTILCQVLVEVITSQQLAASSWDHDNPDERRKMFVAVAMENPAAVLFDNINRGWEVTDSTLERYITSDSINDRLLGKNETATVPTTTLPIFTGNNIAPGTPDLETRSYEIRMERPAKRSKFARPDIVAWTAQNRPKIFAALLCIARSKAGAKFTPVSRFPSWSAAVGAKLQAAAGTTKLFDNWDADKRTFENEDLAELLKQMASKPGWNEDGFLPSEMSDLHTEILKELAPASARKGDVKWTGKAPPKQVFGALRKYDGQLAGGLRLRIGEVPAGAHPRRRDRKVRVFRAVEG